MGQSNYPPGHPTGIGHGSQTEIYFCDSCSMLLEKSQLLNLNGIQNRCPNKDCSLVVERATCDCGKPATHIDEDRAVNACEAFCDEHRM